MPHDKPQPHALRPRHQRHPKHVAATPTSNNATVSCQSTPLPYAMPWKNATGDRKNDPGLHQARWCITKNTRWAGSVVPYPSPRTLTSRFMGSKSEIRWFGEFSPVSSPSGHGWQPKKRGPPARVVLTAFAAHTAEGITGAAPAPPAGRRPALHFGPCPKEARAPHVLEYGGKVRQRGRDAVLDFNPLPMIYRPNSRRTSNPQSAIRIPQSKAVSSSAPVTPGFCHRTPKFPAP